MNKAKRIASVGSYVVTTILIGPCLLSAQAPSPAPSEAPVSGIAAFVILAALLAVLGVGVKLYDIKRNRDEQGLRLQASVSDALLDDPDLARLPLAATVHVSFWRPAAARVVVSGRVPTRGLREAAVRLVLGRVLATWPSARIEDRLVVAPQPVRHAA
jgi:hypothetical protein